MQKNKINIQKLEIEMFYYCDCCSYMLFYNFYTKCTKSGQEKTKKHVNRLEKSKTRMNMTCKSHRVLKGIFISVSIYTFLTKHKAKNKLKSSIVY